MLSAGRSNRKLHRPLSYQRELDNKELERVKVLDSYGRPYCNMFVSGIPTTTMSYMNEHLHILDELKDIKKSVTTMENELHTIKQFQANILDKLSVFAELLDQSNQNMDKVPDYQTAVQQGKRLFPPTQISQPQV